MATPQFYTGDEDESQQAQEAASSGQAGQEEEASPQHSIYSGPLHPLSDEWSQKTDQPSGLVFSRPLPPLQPTAGEMARSPHSDTLGPIRAQAHQRLTGAGVPQHTNQNSDHNSAGQSSNPAWREVYRPYAQRRQWDRARTGRDWPGSLPRSDTERLLMQQLAVAPGAVDPKLLARYNAHRYVLAARSLEVYGGDKLAGTDIFGIAYFGLNFDLDVLPYRSDPLHAHMLATYQSRDHQQEHGQEQEADPLLLLDDTLVSAPPAPAAWAHDPRATIEPDAWRHAIDASWAARFFVGWACATHLTQFQVTPLHLEFVPKVPQQGFADRDVASELNRYALTMLCCAELLAPRERVQRQIDFLLRDKLPHEQRVACMGERWGAAITHYGQWIWPQEAQACRQQGVAFDPVAYLLYLLARMNACPQLLVERSLNEHRGIATPRFWSERLLHELRFWLCPPPRVGRQQINRYQDALATYETVYDHQRRFGRQPLTLTLAL